MKRKTFYLGVVILTFLTGILFTSLWFFKPDFISSKPNILVDDSNITDESYAIYSTLLNEISSSAENGEKVTLFVINENTNIDRVTSTITRDILLNQTSNVPSDFKTSLEDFKLKNNDSQKLTRLFELKQDYILINKAELNTIFTGSKLKNQWDTFYQKYPNSAGFITFSKVGFDAEKQHAFVYWELSCGSLCADGTYFLLTKEPDGWKVMKKINMWVS